MPKLAGRPLKYRNLIEALNNDVVYSPASIVNNGMELGLLRVDQEASKLKTKRIKIRHTLARFAKNHRFPLEGDGYVLLPGQPLARGWTGGRWKEALPVLDTRAAEPQTARAAEACEALA